jgi:hypothetical protein
MKHQASARILGIPSAVAVVTLNLQLSVLMRIPLAKLWCFERRGKILQLFACDRNISAQEKLIRPNGESEIFVMN